VVVAMGAATVFWAAKAAALAQQRNTPVLLSIEVTDTKGRYINGLQPKDFRIREDGIVQKIHAFAEGNKPPVQVLEDGNTRPLGIEAEKKQIEAFESIRKSQSQESLENPRILRWIVSDIVTSTLRLTLANTECGLSRAMCPAAKKLGTLI
jgi:hypothetical protein